MKCAEWTSSDNRSLAATAGHYAGFMLIEHPTPWPRDVSDLAQLRPLIDALQGSGVRLQFIRPANGHIGHRRRIVVYTRTPGIGFAGYARAEESVAAHDVVEAGIALLRGAARGAHSDQADADVLVCAHGSRDVCCGSSGSKVLTEAAGFDGSGSREVRWWYTTHLGGHRFAPTALVLPEGTVWGRLESSSLHAIATRGGSPASFLAFYRGCAGLEEPDAQLIDGEALAAVGWEWLDFARTAATKPSGRVALVGIGPNGTRREWNGVVVRGRELPVPVCRRPIEESSTTEVELLLGAVSEVSLGSEV